MLAINNWAISAQEEREKITCDINLVKRTKISPKTKTYLRR